MSVGIPILTYHKIGRPSSRSTRRGLHTSPEAFDAHLTFLARMGFTFCDFQDVLQASRGLEPLPPKPVLLTLDDGHLDNFTHGLPILREHGAKATVFVLAGEVGKRGVVWPEAGEVEPMDLMTWDEAAEMQASGVRFEVHGWSHRRMDRLAADELRRELDASREQVAERLGYDSVALAYPDGSWNEACLAVVRAAGFEFACTTEDGAADLERDEPLALPRIAVKGYRWKHGWSFRRRMRRIGAS